MTKSTQQLADELARKCANQIHSQYNDEWFKTLVQENKTSEHYAEYVELHRIAVLERHRISAWIIQEGSFLDLLEVARAAKQKNLYNCDAACKCNLCIALTNLQKKVEL